MTYGAVDAVENDNYKFNDDLLIRNDDQEAARALYPSIAYALDHPELRERLARIDPVANRGKKQSRRAGVWAVVFVASALLLAAAEPLYADNHEYAVWAAFASGTLGLIGAAIGSFGLLHARSKREWLLNRLRTEEIRLFHYRSLIELSDLLLAGKKEEFLQRRAGMFREFVQDVLDRPYAALESVLEADWTGEALAPRVPEPPAAPDQDAQREFERAYFRLRVRRQIEYCEYKLRCDGKLFSSFPRQQGRVLGTAAAACLVGTIVIHLLVVLAPALGEMPGGQWPHVLGIWLAIAALALKTLEEGLQPRQEVERYRHYRAAVRAAGDRFLAASDLKEKLAAAAALERASADEMVIFLRSGWESRFMM